LTGEISSNTMLKKVMVIDDDPAILSTIATQLKKEPILLTCISNPVDALQEINNMEFDLIICDIMMEPISGFEVLKTIKASRPGLRVICITGFVDDDVKARAEQLGSNFFLTKPIRKKDLIEAINRTPRIY
jgi:CheY-like chemotaxis protein